MEKKRILMLKGFIIGLGKIIPGVSGSLIAVSMGLYEKCIYSISHFFENIKENIIFLGTIAIGIILSIILGSKVVFMLLEEHYIPTVSIFIGLILGSMLDILKNSKINSIKNFLLITIGIVTMSIIDFLAPNKIFEPTITPFCLLVIFLLGFLDATTMIVPGISGTAIFMMLGCYSFLLNLFSNIWKLSHIYYTVTFGLGLLVGIIIVSKIINCFFKQHQESIYLIILGFALSSVMLLFKEILLKSTKLYDIILGIVFMIFSFFVIKKQKS